MPRKAKRGKRGERKWAPSWKVPPRLPWLRQWKSQQADQVVFNIYRKVVQGVLGLLQMQRRVCGSNWRCRC